MASAGDVALVRQYADIPEDVAPFTDTVLSQLIDAKVSVASATAEVWRRRIPELDKLVDTTESGASHKLSEIPKNARLSLAYWENLAGETAVPVVSGRTHVRKIIRS